MDPVLNALNWFGSYQRLQFTLLFLPIVDCALHILSFIFLGRSFDYKCAESEALTAYLSNHGLVYRGNTTDLNITFNSCGVTATNQSEEILSIDCPGGYEYSEPRELSFIAEWDLVCEKEALADVSQTLFSAGQLCGALFLTILADKYGRKPTYVSCHILFLIAGLTAAFVPTFSAFLVTKFFVGTLQQGIGLVSCILMVELLPTSRRALSSQLGTFLWPCFLLLMVLVCFLCRHLSWRNTQIILSSISIYSLAEPWLIDESLRWLTATGKFEKAEQMIRKIARRNGVDAAKVLTIYRDNREGVMEDSGNGTVTSENSKDLQMASLTNFVDSPYEKTTVTSFEGTHTASTELGVSVFCTNKTVFLHIAIFCFIWFTDSLAYYGLLMTSTSFVDDLYVGFALNVLVEIPAAVPMAVYVNKLGRKPLAWSSHLLGGVSLLVAALLSNSPAATIPAVKTTIVIVSLLGKFGVTLGFAVLWLYTPESFPTTIRSTAFGIASLAARIGGMIAPFSRTLGRHLPWLPGVIFASLCLICALLVLLLPETCGKELPQTVEDMTFAKQSSKSQKISSTKKR